MTTYFTVDRLGTLAEGQVIGLQKYNDISPNFLQQHVDELFPEGVSAHGESYFLRNREDNISGPNIELYFEYVRRALYPTRVSRFQAMFAARSLPEAEAFRIRLKAPEAPIWEVHADDSLAVNMNLLIENNSILVKSYFAGLYWKGEAGPDTSPVWEVLLKLPVRVLRKASQR